MRLHFTTTSCLLQMLSVFFVSFFSQDFLQVHLVWSIHQFLSSWENFIFGVLFTASMWIAVFNDGSRINAAPLRENWGLPCLWAQSLCLTYLLSISKIHIKPILSRCLHVLLLFLTVLLLLVWQFSPFILLTQASSFLGLFLLDYDININK